MQHLTGARPVHCTSVSEHLTSLSFTAHAAALGNSANNESKSIAKWRVYECNVCRCVRLKCGVCINVLQYIWSAGVSQPSLLIALRKMDVQAASGGSSFILHFSFLVFVKTAMR